ncbi:MAG: SRPBCC family protein [Bacteroidia bacterium]
MKFVKGTLYFIVIMLCAALLAAVFSPSEKIVERRISIDSPSETIYKELSDVKQWKYWDAWYSMDTLQVREYFGTKGDSRYGFTYASENPDVGSGRTDVLEMKDNERIDVRYTFNNGFGESSADGYMILDENEVYTDVTFGLVSNRSYPASLLNLFIEKWVGSDFDTGLENLKSQVESKLVQASIESEREVVIAEQFGLKYALVRVDDLPMSDMAEFFETSYTRIYNYLQTNGHTPTGPARGLYYDWDEENGQTTAAAAVPISEMQSVDMDSIRVDSLDMLVGADRIEATIVGGNTVSYSGHIALSQWIDANDKTLIMPVVEEYIVGPLMSTDTSAYITRIIYHF